MVKSAASAASLRGGGASGRLDHNLFFVAFVYRASGQKIAKISDSVLLQVSLTLCLHREQIQNDGQGLACQADCQKDLQQSSRPAKELPANAEP